VGWTQAYAGETPQPTSGSALSRKPAQLRIAAIDPERGFGGGETQVLGLAVELLRAGHQVELFCDPDGTLIGHARRAGIVCRGLRIRNSIDVASGLMLRALLAGNRYDIVHFHTARAHALAPYVRGRTRASVVTRRMDYVPNKVFAPWLYNRAVDAVAAISEEVAAALVSARVKRERIAIIPSGVDCAYFTPPDPTTRANARAELGLAPGDLAIGTVGALVTRKGQSSLLDAMALLNSAMRANTSERGPIRCFVAGEGPLREVLAAQVRRLLLNGYVDIVGPLADPRRLLWALDIFVMPSLKEGLGVAALEAMACGLPVIAGSTGGLREVVIHNETGLLVQPGNATALADALTVLAETPAERLAMGASARERAVTRFGMELMARRTLELYRKILASREAD